MRGHPHERHSELPLSIALGRASARVGRQSHAAGRNRLPAAGAGDGIVTHTTRYPLKQANQALADLRAGRFDGAAVLVP